MTLAVLVHAIFRGRPAPANPWGAATLEWQTTSPPPQDNFAVTPIPGDDPYDFEGLTYDARTGNYSKAGVPSPAGA